METKQVIHWIALALFFYIFSKAGIDKVFQKPGMMEGMAALGFNTQRTLIIGWLEVLGVVAIIVGLWVPMVKNIAILYLMPFGIGALTMHISRQDGFSDYYESLLVCILSVIVLLTDRSFSIKLA